MRPSPTSTRRAAAAGLGLAVAVVVAVLRAAALLPGPVTLALAIVVVVAVPSSRLLARRILWHGAILAGAVPVLWWVDLPLGAVGRAGVLLALGLGGLVTWVAWDGLGSAATRARRLLPDWQVVDLLPVTAGLASLWYLQAWLRVPSGARALAALIPGWDHSAHYGMVHALRLFGATADAVPAPPGTTWQFASYPQGYHAVVATLMEAMSGTTVAAGGVELVTYVRATCLMLMGAAVIVAAGLVALPRLRRRPAIATPVAAVAVAALVIGPGGMSFAHGFVNFVVAAALTACVPLVVVGMPRVAMPVPLAALGGLLVAVAHSWALLLVMALPMAAVVLLPLRRGRWLAARRTWLVCGAILAATAIGLLAAMRILLVHDVGAVLVLPGGVLGPAMNALVLVVLLALGLSLWGATRATTRTTWAAIGPAVGLAMAGGVAALQLRSGGELSYYFWKLMIGVELVSVVVLGMALARWARPVPVQPVPVEPVPVEPVPVEPVPVEPVPVRPGRERAARPGRSRAARLRVAVASVLVTVGATQVFGIAFDGSGIFPVPEAKVPYAEALIRAADVADSAVASGMRTVVLTPQAADAPNPMNAQQWHLGMTGRWTLQADALAAGAVVNDGGGAQDLLTATRALLATPDVVVIAPPEAAAAIRAELPADLAARVLSP